MVRIKFTRPVSTVRSPHPQPRDRLDSINGNASSTVNSVAQAQTQSGPGSTAHESSSLMQQQSLEMVKIMLHVSLGTLFYLREFLPLPCFEDRDLKEALREQKLSYQGFIGGIACSNDSRQASETAFGKGKRGQPLKVILRGSDPKADTIMDALETGIFDALSKSVLEAIQLTILVDKEMPDNVLETYTFSFKYTGGHGDLPSRLESLSIEPVGYVADMKTAQTARIGLETIVRRLITLSAFLPTLPSKRILGIHLFYTEDCPPDYEPPGFNGARDGTINYPLTENWRKETQACGSMDSGCHTVGLKVTSLKWVGPDVDGAGSLPEIPSQLEYKDSVQRIEDIGFDDAKGFFQSSASGSTVSFPHTSLETANLEPVNSQETTQDIVEKEKLQMMMMPTQDSPPDSDLVPTQSMKTGNNLEVNKYPSEDITKFTLSSRTVGKIKQFRASLENDRLVDATSQSDIKCQCGWDGEDPSMIKCDFCHTRQHLLCYGYDDANNSRVPDIHACYQCLLEPNGSHLLSELNDLVLQRRALRIILNEGFPARTSIFTEKLHCNGQTVIQVTDLLRKQGFLQPTPGYKTKGFLRKGLPKFYVPTSEEVQLRIKTEIFDPLVKIENYYTKDVPRDSLEALSPPVTSQHDRTRHNSQDEDIPSSGRPKDQQPTSAVSTMLPRNQRMTALDNISDACATESREQSIKTPSTRELSQNITPRSTRKRTRDLQNEPEVVVASQQATPGPRDVEDEGLRRSGRKKRKISNYSKLINVGADTSGSESS